MHALVIQLQNSIYLVRKENEQGVNLPWEMMCNVIFQIGSNLPIVSILISEIEVIQFGK